MYRLSRLWFESLVRLSATDCALVRLPEQELTITLANGTVCVSDVPVELSVCEGTCSSFDTSEVRLPRSSSDTSEMRPCYLIFHISEVLTCYAKMTSRRVLMLADPSAG